jgi:hypothetical protein
MHRTTRQFRGLNRQSINTRQMISQTTRHRSTGLILELVDVRASAPPRSSPLGPAPAPLKPTSSLQKCPGNRGRSRRIVHFLLPLAISALVPVHRASGSFRSRFRNCFGSLFRFFSRSPSPGSRSRILDLVASALISEPSHPLPGLPFHFIALPHRTLSSRRSAAGLPKLELVYAAFSLPARQLKL